MHVKEIQLTIAFDILLLQAFIIIIHRYTIRTVDRKICGINYEVYFHIQNDPISCNYKNLIVLRIHHGTLYHVYSFNVAIGETSLRY